MNKTKLFTISVLLILCNSCEQTIEPETLVFNDYYCKLYGTYYDDLLNCVLRLDENQIATGGYYTDTYEDKQVGSIYVSDSAGMVLWKHITQTEGNSKVFDLYFDNTNQLLSAAYSLEMEDSLARVYVLQFDNVGIVQDSSSFEIEGNIIQNIQIVPQDSSSNLYLVQYQKTNITEGEIANFQDVYAENDSGSFDISYKIALDQKLEDIKLVYHNNNEAYITATAISQLKTSIYLGMISNRGIVWSRFYTHFNDSSLSSADLIIRDNEVMIAGNISSTPQSNTSNGIYLMATDLSGGEPLYKTTLDYGNNTRITSFAINDSGNYVFTGSEYIDLESSNALFVELSPIGEEINRTIFGKSGQNSGKFIEEISPGNYLLAGEMYSLNNFDMFNMKLNEEGDWVE